MTDKKPSPRFLSREKRIEQRVLSDWLGVPPPKDPNRHISQASEHLEALLKRFGVAEGIDEEKLRREWATIAGDFVAQHTSPTRLLKGTLEIQVLQPAMRFHLEQMKGELTRKLRQHLGEKKVRTVRFTLG